MIIHEDNSETQSSSPTKSSTLGLPAAERRETSPAPPSYTIATSMTSNSAGPNSPLLPYQPSTSSRAHGIHPEIMSQDYQNQAAYAVVEQRRRDINRRTRARFCQALFIGVLCYLLLTAVIGSMVVNVEIPWDGDATPLPPYNRHPAHPDAPHVPQPNPTDRDQPPGAPVDKRPWPAPEDGEVIRCSGEDSWSPEPPTSPFTVSSMNDITWSGGGKDESLPYTGYNTFALPVNATSKEIFSKGRHASGSLILRTREADEDKDSIMILVQASYRYREALECKICILKRKDGSRALGIYTSRDFDGSKDIRFTVDVFFPRERAAKAAPLPMGVVSIALSWFDYTISTLDAIHFKALTLATESDKMHSNGVLADIITLVGNNGDITGNFNITEEGNFATTNAKIDVDLNIFQIDDERPSKVTLSTNNAPIMARNSLYHSTGEQGSSGGNFSLVALTKNAHADISFAAAPVDSILSCVVTTSNANAKVHLHPTFEGDVTLVTSNGETMVHQADGIEDPSGRERDRLVSWKHMWKSWWIGWVGWGEKKQAGSLVVNTSNGGNHLYL